MLANYKDFISKYSTVGTSVCYLDMNDKFEEVLTGYMELEHRIETKIDTIYRIASISKVIVAMGILKLYDQGLVSLDEDISKYLGYRVRNPKYVDDIITIRMIMSQTSSITDSGSSLNSIITGYDGSNSTNDYIPLKNLLTPLSINYDDKTYSNYKPGTNFQYSNLGCGILACIIEMVTKRFFINYIKEEILLPLGIESGFRLEDIKDKSALASFYLYEDDKFILYRNYELFKKVQCFDYPIGDNYRGVAGGLYINIKDLSKIMSCLMHKGKYQGQILLKEETIKMMKQVQWEGKSIDPTYHKKGLQLIIMDEFTKKPLYGHFGNAYGLRSFMLFNDNGGIIFLCNGANFLSNEEHMTILQKDLIKFLVEENNM